MCLETDRLRLMPLLASQLMAMIENKAQLVNQLGWGIDSAELDSKMKFIYQLKINNIENDRSNLLFYTYWAIVLKSTNELVGEVGFKGIPDERGEIEVGYGLENEKYYGKGYMTEALTSLVAWAFAQPNVLSVVADTDKDNIASQKVLEKSGLKYWKEENDYIWWKIQKH